LVAGSTVSLPVSSSNFRCRQPVHFLITCSSPFNSLSLSLSLSLFPTVSTKRLLSLNHLPLVRPRGTCFGRTLLERFINNSQEETSTVHVQVETSPTPFQHELHATWPMFRTCLRNSLLLFPCKLLPFNFIATDRCCSSASHRQRFLWSNASN
jgi:hypothetical protein